MFLPHESLCLQNGGNVTQTQEKNGYKRESEGEGEERLIMFTPHLQWLTED